MNPSWHVDADADADDDDDDDDGGELKASGLRLSFRAYEDIYIERERENSLNASSKVPKQPERVPSA